MMSDPIIQETLRAIKNIEEFVNNSIKPWEPDAAYRAHCLFRSLAKPYIDNMCDYLATRPKAASAICSRRIWVSSFFSAMIDLHCDYTFTMFSVK